MVFIGGCRPFGGDPDESNRSGQALLEGTPPEEWDGFVKIPCQQKNVAESAAEVVAEDPVGTARFMENTHRPTQAVVGGERGPESARGFGARIFFFGSPGGSWTLAFFRTRRLARKPPGKIGQESVGSSSGRGGQLPLIWLAM